MLSDVSFRRVSTAFALAFFGCFANAQTIAPPLAYAASGSVIRAESTSLPKEVIQQRLESTPITEFDNRGKDQLWLVSSRRLGSRNCGVNSLDVRQRGGGDVWQPSSASAFFAPDPDEIRRPIVIFIHGNRWSLDKAIRRGLQTYEQTIVPWNDAPAMRYVIWAWPADQIAGPIRDVRIKAERADEHSFHLARFLQNIDPRTPVSIIGFSFGGRVSLGALHLIGGGTIDGCGLPSVSHPIAPVNLTLAVPAIRNDCLVTTRCRAYSQINHLDLVYNSRDSYLSLFRFTWFDNKRPALGYTGISGLNQLPDHSTRVHQFNAAQFVGREHDYLEYISDQRIEASLRRHLLIGFPQ